MGRSNKEDKKNLFTYFFKFLCELLRKPDPVDVYGLNSYTDPIFGHLISEARTGNRRMGETKANSDSEESPRPSSPISVGIASPTDKLDNGTGQASACGESAMSTKDAHLAEVRTDEPKKVNEDNFVVKETANIRTPKEMNDGVKKGEGKAVDEAAALYGIRDFKEMKGSKTGENAPQPAWIRSAAASSRNYERVSRKSDVQPQESRCGMSM